MRKKSELKSLTKLTCVIPFMDDSVQRRHNLSAVVGYLTELGCAIVVAESGARQCAPEVIGGDSQKCTFHFDAVSGPFFHHTRVRNRAAHSVRTELIALWDADIVIPYRQLISTAVRLLEGACDLAFPYDGRFVDFSDHVAAGSLSSAMRRIAFADQPPQVEAVDDSVIAVRTGG
jgi:hypothetical protein